MNIFLWILQIILALHTAIGAVWKFSNSAKQTAPSLKAISDGVWKGMSIIELLCSLGLILPAFNNSLAILTPLAAIILAAEMLFFSAVHIYSDDKNYNSVIYWIIVAAIGAFIAFGRFLLAPF